MANDSKTYATTLREIFTPGLDRFTGGTFLGNHRDFVVSFTREGDKLTVDYGWIRDSAGVLIHRESKVYSIREMIEGLTETATECGMAFDCRDDIPEGSSYPPRLPGKA